MVYSNEVNAEYEPGEWLNERVSQYMQKIETINSKDHKPPPRHQINIGIFHKDVICNNNLVLVLKWSANNVACVKQETAEKLIERQWGITRSLTYMAGIELPTCFPAWEIIYDDLNHHSDSKIIKTVRFVLKEFYQEPWMVVDVGVPLSLDNLVSVSIDRCLDEKIEIKIAEELGKIEHVVKAEFSGTILV